MPIIGSHRVSSMPLPSQASGLARPLFQDRKRPKRPDAMYMSQQIDGNRGAATSGRHFV
jgi:hypothetical protein